MDFQRMETKMKYYQSVITIQTVTYNIYFDINGMCAYIGLTIRYLQLFAKYLYPNQRKKIIYFLTI